MDHLQLRTSIYDNDNNDSQNSGTVETEIANCWSLDENTTDGKGKYRIRKQQINMNAAKPNYTIKAS